MTPMTDLVVRYTNCLILRDRKLQECDLWTRNGIVINPQRLFYVEKKTADVVIDCMSAIISPGFIDIQINGAIGFDFSMDCPDYSDRLTLVSKFLLSHGVTSYCPTLVTSSPQTYKSIIPKFEKKSGGSDGAEILGLHLEGPFISKSRKGAHCGDLIRECEDTQNLLDCYGSDLSHVAIVTMAPEMVNADEILPYLLERNIIISIGHTNASLEQATCFVKNGANLITHLFNAMAPFHHREPNTVGLLSYTEETEKIFYGIIADGIHVHPSSVKMAHSVSSDRFILITDAMSAMGLNEGVHKIGTVEVDVKPGYVTVNGTDVLAGSVTTIPKSIRNLIDMMGFTVVEALSTATEHPAELLKIKNRKGTLEFYTDADFVILSPKMMPLVTVIAGIPVWQSCDSNINLSMLF